MKLINFELIYIYKLLEDLFLKRMLIVRIVILLITNLMDPVQLRNLILV